MNDLLLAPIGISLPFEFITFGSKPKHNIRFVSIRYWIQLKTPLNIWLQAFPGF